MKIKEEIEKYKWRIIELTVTFIMVFIMVSVNKLAMYSSSALVRII